MKPTDFSVHVTGFLTHYLAAQRNVSPNTIKAYPARRQPRAPTSPPPSGLTVAPHRLPVVALGG
jgi:hypothetical protein